MRKNKKKDEKLTFFNGTWIEEEILGAGSYGTVYKAKKSALTVTTYSAIKRIEIPHDTAEVNTLKSEGLTDKEITGYYDDVVKKWVEEIEWSRAIMETVIETAFEVLTKKGLSILIGSVAAAVLTACLGPLGLSASMILVPAVGNAIGDVVGEAVYVQADLLYKEYYAEKFGQEPENISEQVSDWIFGEDDNIRK